MNRLCLPAQNAYKNTYDFLVNNEGYGLPATRRQPYADYGIVLAQAITGSGSPQTLQNRLLRREPPWVEAERFIHIDLGGSNEKYVQVLTLDPYNPDL